MACVCSKIDLPLRAAPHHVNIVRSFSPKDLDFDSGEALETPFMCSYAVLEPIGGSTAARSLPRTPLRRLSHGHGARLTGVKDLTIDGLGVKATHET